MSCFDAFTGKRPDGAKGTKIKGTVVLMKKNVLDFNDLTASLLDRMHEILGQGVTFQLVSATVGDPSEFSPLPFLLSSFI